MKIHFIAIGGSAMHNLALALKAKGYTISGTDDEIYNPSKSRLEEAGILPPKMGWFPEKITEDLDLIILGMHARKDNPELIKALEMGIPVYSYPAYIAQAAAKQQRVVIAGSHGKTTTTSMIMEAMRFADKEFDYLVGAQLKNFSLMVKVSEAPVMIIEGDEYLSSPIDPRPKILHYKPHIAVITGIAWDHINVFRTFAEYIKQFTLFIDTIEPNGVLIYNNKDSQVVKLLQEITREDLQLIPYKEVPLSSDRTILSGKESYRPDLVGRHNYQNMAAAKLVCNQLGISEMKFFQAMENFRGAAKRLQVIKKNPTYKFIAYLDFAHAPSKVSATVSALKEWYPDRKLYAVLELHTFSSLNKDFLPLYQGSLDSADKAMVFYNNHTLEMKKMPTLDKKEVIDAFAKDNLVVSTNSSELKQWIAEQKKENAVFLLMTSGNFQGIDLECLF